MHSLVSYSALPAADLAAKLKRYVTNQAVCRRWLCSVSSRRWVESIDRRIEFQQCVIDALRAEVAGRKREAA